MPNPLDLVNLGGIPGASPAAISVAHSVRELLRDHPELNRLVAGQETSNRMILHAVGHAVTYINMVPHPTQYSLEALLSLNALPLIQNVAVIRILEGVGLLQTRNHISYSNGGKTMGVNDKTPLIERWLRYYRSTTDQMLQQVKVSWNLLSILGADQFGFASEYYVLHSTYATW